MRSKSTELMERIIQYVDKQFCISGGVPTMTEIALALNISIGCVSNYIAEMKRKGMIENNNGWHGIRTKTINKFSHDMQFLPVVGSVACGTPVLAEENIETYVPVSSNFLGNGKHFLLKAKGESMINAGVADGDYVIVKQQEVAEEGQIVVALIDDEATLKRYYIDRKNKRIRLHPENDAMEDMYFDDVKIQGVAVKVLSLKDLA